MSVTYTSTCDLLNLFNANHIFVLRVEHLVLDSQLVVSSMGNRFVQSQNSLIPVVLGIGFRPHGLFHIHFVICLIIFAQLRFRSHVSETSWV